MINFFAQLPTKKYINEQKGKSVTLILFIIALFTLNSCAQHSITLGDLIVHGSNEQKIYAPERK